MSMFDSFFHKGFNASKCKTLLKLSIPRIKLLRNKRELQIKQMRRDIAKLLEIGQEATACVRVEHIIREEKMMAAHEIIELFCELISARLPIIETQSGCPMDLKESITSLCFAAPRCADLPELLQVKLAFASKYGKEFIAAATQLMPDCGVNRQLIELLSVSAPSSEKKLKLLKEIAEEHGLDWDLAASETELFKPHEDLLDGSKVPLPKGANEQCDSDSGLDSLDFLEIPKVILRPNTESVFTREKSPHPTAPHPELNQEQATEYENIAHQTSMGPKEDILRDSDHEAPRASETRQFVPFVYPPPPATESPTHSLLLKSEINMGLDDVLFAAQTAADSAERAASAARSAASLAHFRISGISGKKYRESLDTCSDNPFGMNDDPSPPATKQKLHLDDENYEFNNNARTSSFDEQVNLQHLPQMEDDPLSSYPYLFGSRSQSFTETSRSNT